MNSVNVYIAQLPKNKSQAPVASHNKALNKTHASLAACDSRLLPALAVIQSAMQRLCRCLPSVSLPAYTVRTKSKSNCSGCMHAQEAFHHTLPMDTQLHPGCQTDLSKNQVKEACALLNRKPQKQTGYFSRQHCRQLTSAVSA